MSEQEYQIIDPKVFPDHILREDIDECRFDKAAGSYGRTWFKVKGIKGATVSKHCREYSFRCLKKDHPGMVVEQPTKSIALEANKTYLTSGGYVVHMVDDKCNISKETSAGLNNLEEDITKACSRVKRTTGWQYKRDGSIYLNYEWEHKMKITEVLPFSLPTLPLGYVWAGGFPQFRVPIKGEYFMRYHSKTGFGDVVKCDGNFQIPFGEETRRLIVVPSEQPLSTEGMVEVNHLPDYIVQRDDIYVENGRACSPSILISLHPVKWYGNTVKLFATKKNYGDYVSKNSAKPVTESHPQIGVGYREINSKIDTPQEGDQFWSNTHKQWMDRPMHFGAFNHIDTYRRINKLTAKNDVSVPAIGASALIQNVSVIGASSPIQKENVMSSTKSEETIKFETAKKIAASTAKLAGKAIWRTADYFVFAPIKKAASPFMWMVRYAVLGTMVGGGVYASFNPDDAKELLWKCVPKISISVEAPEVLG